MKKGKLVRVQIGPGQFMKVYESDLPKNKQAIPQGNKLAPGPENKSSADPVSPAEEVQADDLSSIDGVGKASERVLNDHDFYTFEALAAAGDLAFLGAKVNAKIQEWRDGLSAEVSD